MNDYLPKSELEPEKDPKRTSNARLTIWIVVTAVALYLIGSGVWGIINN
ncbi:hypothetical protein MN032_00380 [Agromyces atrinae]|uniref:Nitric oxide reductase large subunit n=1 Tax=Agromyces atrinae TaxID=592376 RepID=A0A852SIW4_9MICO|nr:hypothetical protein [Agromyces atrinae]MCI2956133.1 hypothetical protein [Agromyces atrinae]NYD68455.1 nitric oxide reductase large subunit [Agromyces atrinae]